MVTTPGPGAASVQLSQSRGLSLKRIVGTAEHYPHKTECPSHTLRGNMWADIGVLHTHAGVYKPVPAQSHKATLLAPILPPALRYTHLTVDVFNVFVSWCTHIDIIQACIDA